jgi:hypothetical protein
MTGSGIRLASAFAAMLTDGRVLVRQSVYVVAESDLGVQHLERYPLPR